MTFVRELEEKIQELKEKLVERENELEKVQRELEVKTKDHEGVSGQVRTRDVQGLEFTTKISELEKEQEEMESEKKSLADLNVEREKELGAVKDELEKTKNELVNSSESGKQVVQLKGELEALSLKLAKVSEEQKESQTRLDLAQERAISLEKGLEEEKIRHQSELDALNKVLEAEQDQHQAHVKGTSATSEVVAEERRKIVEAVGDVLRRHRTRAVIGPVLRHLPPFDDTTSRTDLPFYLASSLESHFDRLSNHVATVSSELELAKTEHGVSVETLEAQLHDAVEARDKLQLAAENAVQEKEELERAKRDLQAQFDAREQEEIVLRQELDSLTSRSTESSNQQTKTLQSLQQVWKSIPPLESRTNNSNSDDLTILKSAFELSKKPTGIFSADLNAAKFSVESLVERIRLLLIEDSKLVQKLVKFESEQGVHKASAEKAETLLAASTVDLKALEKQVSLIGFLLTQNNC